MDCGSFRPLRLRLECTLRHIKDEQCTVCAQELVDQVARLLEILNTTLIKIDHERSEVEAQRALIQRKTSLQTSRDPPVREWNDKVRDHGGI